MPIPSNKKGGVLPDLTGNSKPDEPKKSVLPAFDELDNSNTESKSTGLPDLSVPNKEEPKHDEHIQDEQELEDDKEFMSIEDSTKDDSPITSYDNNNSFEELSESEVHNEDLADEVELENTEKYVQEPTQETYEEPRPQPVQNVQLEKPIEKEQPPMYDDRFAEGTKTPDEEPEEYIDKKKRKLIPFGGKKTKRKNAEGSMGGNRLYDDRKDLAVPVKWIRLGTMSAIVVVVGLGVYNTFFRHVPNQAEITSIAQNISGNVGFPTQRGQAFAEQFLSAYLEVNGNSSQPNSNVLDYFYSGAGIDVNNKNPSGGSNMPTPTYKGKVNQKVLVSPKTYNTIVASDSSATYYLSALVSDATGKSQNKDGSLTTHWVSFAVNVLYDKKHDTVAISQTSPSLIPSFNVTQDNISSKTPSLGTGTQYQGNDISKMRTALQGFISAYADSTSTDHDEVNQFVNSDADVSVFDGFGGQLKPADNQSMDTTIFPTTDSDTNKEYKVFVSLNWTMTSGKSSITYPGQYVVTMEKSGGKYFITKIVPYTYVKTTTSD